MTRTDALSRLDQTLLCLESCVQHFAVTDPVLAVTCEDSIRALIQLRSAVFNGMRDYVTIESNTAKPSEVRMLDAYAKYFDGLGKTDGR